MAAGDLVVPGNPRLTASQREVQAIVRLQGLCGAVNEAATVTCLRYENHRGFHGDGWEDPDEIGQDMTGSESADD